MIGVLMDDAPVTPVSLDTELLTLLAVHTPGLSLEARQKAVKAFVQSLEWMESNPDAWEIKPPTSTTYTSQLDKPHRIVVRGRIVDVYKAVTI